MNTTDVVDICQVQTMDSREIAELTGKEHKHVIRDIQTMLEGLTKYDGPNLDHQLPKGIMVDMDARGYVALYHLDRAMTYTLITGYRVDLRAKVINRWMELERYNLLEANAAEKKAVESRKSQRVTNVAKLPAGIQLHELRMIYGSAAAKRLDYLIGYEAGVSLPEEGKAPPAIAEAAFQKIGKLFDEGARA